MAPTKTEFDKNNYIVIKKALEGDIYPCKTVKHDFNFSILECDYKFSDLKI